MNSGFGNDLRDRLRPIVSRIDQEISQLAPTSTLVASWSELVQMLALGPAPETRICPACGGVGMRAATRCWQCWGALERLPATAAGEADQAVP
jgi:hypothetical protein